MLRSRSIPLALLAASIAACSGDSVSRPIEPPRFLVSASAESIDDQITALFPEGGLRNAMLARWANLQRQVAANDMRAARQNMLVGMIDFTLQLEKRERLLDPNGAASPTTEEAVRLLIASLFQFVYPGAPAPPVLAEGVDFGVGVIHPRSGGLVVTAAGHAGADVPANSWDEAVLLTITERPDPAPGGSGPLPGTYTQYPKFYDFTPFPNDPTQRDIRIGICHVTDETSPYYPPGNHSLLRIAKETHDVPPQLLVLDRVQVDDFLRCIDVEATPPFIIGARPSALRTFAGTMLRGAVDGLAWLVVPKNAYAIDQGIGGVLRATEDEGDIAFSLFGIVQVPAPPLECTIDLPCVIIDDPKGPIWKGPKNRDNTDVVTH